MNKQKTLVAIGAHHDDVELRCGGTLARYKQMGWRVVYVVATTTPWYGQDEAQIEAGTFLTNAEAIGLREREATAAARVLGLAEIHFWRFKSQYWYVEGSHETRYLDGHHSTPEEFRFLNEQLPGREFILNAHRCKPAVDFLLGFLTDLDPDIVLTHFPDDGHIEHYATARFVFAAAQVLHQRGHGLRLYAWEYGGADMMLWSFAPTHFVELAEETVALKCRSVKEFPSQQRADPTRFERAVRSRAREWGAAAGTSYAEPFMLFKLEHTSQGKIVVPGNYDPARASRGL